MGILKPKTIRWIYYYLFLALSFLLPLHGRLIPPVIGLILLTWILEFNFVEKIKRIRNSTHRKKILSFSILYILYIIGVLYSSQLSGSEGAFFDLEVKLSLLIFPVLFSTIDFSKLKSDFQLMVLKLFILGSLVGSVLLLSIAVYNYLSDNDLSVFYYTKLSAYFHPSYLALYFTFSIAIILSRFIHGQKLNLTKKIIAVSLILYFQVFIILLSSKAGILGVGIIYIIFAVYLIIKKNYFKRLILPGSVALIIFLIAVLFIFPRSYERFSSSLIPQKQQTDNSYNSVVARIQIWKSAFEVVKKNPIFGVGTGDIKPELRKVYKEKIIRNDWYEHLNAHNQFIQTTIALGVIGLLILLGYFILPAVYAFRKNNSLYLFFLTIVGFHFLFESMLERQAGVVFYAFFNTFLFYYIGIITPKDEDTLKPLAPSNTTV